MAGSACRGPFRGVEPDQLVLSSRWQASVQKRPLAFALCAWEELSPRGPARPLGLQCAADALASGRIDDALEELEAGRAAAPEKPLFYAARGYLELCLGYHRAAEGSFERALALEPDDAASWAALGRARLALELHVSATRAFERAIALGRDDATHYVLLARALRGAGRSQASAHAYRAAWYAWNPHPADEVLGELARVEEGEPGTAFSVFARRFAFVGEALRPAPRPPELPEPSGPVDRWSGLSELFARR